MGGIPSQIRALLACPRCHGGLRDARADGRGGEAGRGTTMRDGTALVCEACALVFPVEAGIPVLLTERARARTSE
ncbi:MAG: hypothetical protein C0503_12065 [Gemmatimonas sp.]|nr:hypothetical protein [Gemmatimonas sp.]